MGTLAVNSLVVLGTLDKLPTQCVKCYQFGWDRDSLQPIQDTPWWQSVPFYHAYTYTECEHQHLGVVVKWEALQPRPHITAEIVRELNNSYRLPLMQTFTATADILWKVFNFFSSSAIRPA